jgi:RNase P/RNase MRP subunit p29
MSDISIYDLVGKRVRLIKMFDDTHPVEPGTEGKVMSVGMDVISVDWDNGRVLGMIWDLDEYEVIG